jgi:hypothetical protein
MHLHDLEKRLVRLERHRDVLVLVMGVLVFGALTSLLYVTASAAGVPKRLEAEQFILKDRDGTERGAIRIRSGVPVFELTYQGSSVFLSVGSQGPVISLAEPTTGSRATIAAGETTVGLLMERGTAVASAGVTAGGPGIVLDNGGPASHKLYLHDGSQESGLQVFESNGVVRIDLALAHREAALNLYRPDGSAAWSSAADHTK